MKMRIQYLLRVSSALELGKVAVWVHGAQKDWFELVHSGIGKQQSGIIVGHNAAGGHLGVALGLKELNESCPYSVPCSIVCIRLYVVQGL